MKKLYVVGLALFAVFAFGAMVAQSAFAEVHLWLVSGNTVVTLTSVEASGEILLSDLKVPLLGEVMVLCSGVLDGSVGAEGEDEITEFLTLAVPGVLVDLAHQLLCESQTTACIDPKVSADNLPWHSQLELMSGMSPPEETLDILLGSAAGLEPGWEVVCELSTGGTIEDLCEALPGEAQLGIENMAGESDVLAIFDTETGLSPMAECTLSKEHSGDVFGEGLVTALEGLALAVSAP